MEFRKFLGLFVLAQLFVACLPATLYAETGTPSGDEPSSAAPKGPCHLSLAELAVLRGPGTVIVSPQRTADGVMNYLKNKFGDLSTEEGRESVLDGIGERLRVQLRPGATVLGKVTLGTLGQQGPKTKEFIANLTSLQADIGAITPRGASESWAKSLARRTPVLGGLISKRLNLAETGSDSITRAREKVEEIIAQGVEARKDHRKDQIAATQELADLGKKIEAVELFRSDLERELAQMPAGSSEWAFLSQVAGKLEDTEETLRSQSIVLAKGIKRSTIVQTSVTEGISTLRNVTSVHLLDLESALSAQAGAAVAAKMQQVAASVKSASEKANLIVSETVLDTTRKGIAMQKDGAFDLNAVTQADTNLETARTEQAEFEQARANNRRARIAALKIVESQEKKAIAEAEEKRAISLGLESTVGSTLALPRPQ